MRRTWCCVKIGGGEYIYILEYIWCRNTRRDSVFLQSKQSFCCKKHWDTPFIKPSLFLLCSQYPPLVLKPPSLGWSLIITIHCKRLLHFFSTAYKCLSKQNPSYSPPIFLSSSSNQWYPQANGRNKGGKESNPFNSSTLLIPSRLHIKIRISVPL